MGGTATAGTGYVRVVRPPAGLTVRGEFRIMTGLLLGMPVAVTAIFAAQGQLPWGLPAAFAVAGAAAMVSLSRVDRGPDAQVSEAEALSEAMLGGREASFLLAQSYRREADGLVPEQDPSRIDVLMCGVPLG